MERAVAVLGMLVILAAAILLSNNRKAINWRTVGAGLGLQFVLALLILRVPGTRDAFMLMGNAVEGLLSATVQGATFVLNKALVVDQFIFAIRIGVAIIFVASLSALAYYLGIMQKVVKVAAKVLTKTMGISGPEAVSTAAAVFVGQVECQVLIKPYLSRLTSSELFCSLTAAMATISGSALVAYTAMGMNPTHLIAASVMSAVGGIVMAKIFCPETDKEALKRDVSMANVHDYANAFDAMTSGALDDGWKIARNVVIMVAISVTYVTLLNGLLSASLAHLGMSATVQDILGVCFTPIAWLMGTPWHEAFHVGRLMATEIIVNEFAAYGELSKVIAGAGPYVLAAKTQMIATMALCGFANLGSIAINIGGWGAMAPERKKEVARVAFRALIAANFATWMTAAMAGLLF